MEGVMDRPPSPADTADEMERAEVEKWDAWHAQAGLSKTEAKRRYITTLIEVSSSSISLPPAHKSIRRCTGTRHPPRRPANSS